MKIELGRTPRSRLEAREKAVKEQLAPRRGIPARPSCCATRSGVTESKSSWQITPHVRPSMMAESRQSSWSRAHADRGIEGPGYGMREGIANPNRLTQERAESETAPRILTDGRSRVGNLSQRVTDLDRQLISRSRRPRCSQPRQ